MHGNREKLRIAKKLTFSSDKPFFLHSGGSRGEYVHLKTGGLNKTGYFSFTAKMFGYVIML